MERIFQEHWWLQYLIVLGSGGISVWLIKKMFDANIATLNALRDSIQDLYNKYGGHEHRLSNLEGEHNAFTGKGIHKH